MLPSTPTRQAPPVGDAALPSPLPPPRHSRWRFGLSVDALLLLAALWFTASANLGFVRAALKGRAWADPSAWGLGAALLLIVLALHALLLALVATRWTIKPLLALLVIASASADFYMRQYGVYMDPTMMRNVLRTDAREAAELLGPALLLHLALFAGLPLLLLWRVRLRPRQTWPRAVLRRLGLMALALALLVGVGLAVFQPLASLMRNQRELRYLITPANVLWSTAVALRGDLRAAQAPRQPLGLDARLGDAQRGRPLLVVLVVGETVRAANWGLSGYARQTTPELARIAAQGPELLNFPYAGACGTNTETSVPCLFAPVGRRDYDEDRIRNSESLLHVLARAGVGVAWRDNQSGCKGVCDGLSVQKVSDGAGCEGPVEGERCLDEALLGDLPQRLREARGTQLLVLHQLGNHGPAYYRRYPPAFARFQPECRSDDLRTCSREAIVNAYDNAVLYTDHLLARLIGELQAASDAGGGAAPDTALIYVSDHGESLGEGNLFLHGLPYAIAPDAQTRVPLLMWLSPGLRAHRGIDLDCLRQRAAQPAAHDDVFHTLLTLLDVRTALHDPAWDLVQACVRAGG
jgi:lipid A ethanolaminephosphotransferase